MRSVLALLTLAIAVGATADVDAGSADNVRTAERVFLEGMASGSFAQLQDIYAPGFVAHAALFNYTLQQDMASTASWHAAMPDLSVTVKRAVADRDHVALHWKAVGTNTVAAGGLPGKGERMGIEGMTFFRFVSGRIAEEWSVLDVAPISKLLEQ
jgi:steroid delta-isomerase-like uncharacterized protein